MRYPSLTQRLNSTSVLGSRRPVAASRGPVASLGLSPDPGVRFVRGSVVASGADSGAWVRQGVPLSCGVFADSTGRGSRATVGTVVSGVSRVRERRAVDPLQRFARAAR